MNNEAPPGSPEDFKRETPEERALREGKRANLNDAEAEFQREQKQIADDKARRERERKAFEQGQGAVRPANVKYLLVAKKPRMEGGKQIASAFTVVGFYSSHEQLAMGLAGAVMAYANVGQTLGAIEFDLSVKLDQPAVDPK